MKTPSATLGMIVANTTQGRKDRPLNMKFGKTIKIFLIDGDPNGRMSCELSNWSGKAYKIPRIKIKDCTDRD